MYCVKLYAASSAPLGSQFPLQLEGGEVSHWYRPYKGLRGLIWKENVISRGEWPKVVLPVDYSTYHYHM